MADSPSSTHDGQVLLLPCHECDLVSEVVIHRDGQWLQCPRCQHPLMRPAQNDQLTPALAFTALLPVSYTTSPSPRDKRQSRMPSSA